MDIDQANEEFGIPGSVQICAGRGDLPLIIVDNAFARAEISAYAGQVLSYCPEDAEADLLFVSREARFQRGQAIKGGIPVCWPWFGPDPEVLGRPDHGFVRTRQWTLLLTEVMADGAVRIRLGITDDAASRALWPHAFALELEVTIGRTLEVALVSRNPGDAPVTLTQALHAYFRIGNIRQAQVLGLAGHEYIDKVGEAVRRRQSGPVNFDGPVNRIYVDTLDGLIIDDPALGRRIHIEREGSRSVVVWNPWIGQAQAMADFGDDEYSAMLCVESANAGDDEVTLAPGASHRLATRYAIRSD
ncbi:D-hexose-6-phosphate mutarotase [Thiohalocapsa marina]|uniref:Putative glucose-6-phosphate 1-epimerase n=1 Tax=Thiohalocapsa marina TaxID=424902 RepID=A0A5M8FHF1_9GAMM|nr:D-hexose-6-phosphate mutarotase [Thiohalocapsa marina]KAA6184308.1 D-hexose-6-phosphate mutarotase [Thiohalocapsa marina]